MQLLRARAGVLNRYAFNATNHNVHAPTSLQVAAAAPAYHPLLNAEC